MGKTDATSNQPVLMAIGPERVTRRIEQVVGSPIMQPDSIFDAVGEIMLGKAGGRAVTMLVTSEHLRHGAEATVTTLRAIVPGLRLIALVPTSNGSARTAPHPLSALADAVLFEPASDDELRAAIGAKTAAAKREEPKRIAKEQTPVEAPKPAKPAAPAQQPHAAAPTPPAKPAPPPPTPFPVNDTEPIGDTDLIDEIMFGPDALARRALALIRQQTGWKDVRLVTDPGEHAFAPVACAGETFGRLVANDADAESLSTWANWLARWLALDRSYRQFRLLTYRDDLTGAWNRRFFDAFLSDTLKRAAQQRRPITVMVFDLDGFKRFNDMFGHDAGDEILRETVRLLTSVIRKGDRVCRIGGDEFAVVFGDLEAPRAEGSQHPDSVEAIASRFQDQIRQMKFPKLGAEAPGTLSISAGLATYPWDGATAANLLMKADQLAMESKRRGKNVITFGPGAAEFHKRKNGDEAK